MIKIQELPNGQFTITIPKKIAQIKGWKKGTEITFKEHGVNSLVIEVMKKDETKKRRK